MIHNRRISKYVLYAVGEILLVVIGILIALQVNNWNEKRKEQNELIVIKENLYDEFQDNRTVLADRIALIEKALDHSEQVLSYMGASEEDIDRVNMDSIIVYSLYYGNFNPPNSTILELLQAGKLKLIEDKVLKKYLADWLQMLEDTDEDFKNQDLQANEFLMPYINDHISQRNIDLYGKYRMTNSRSKLIEDYYDEVLNDFRFENLMISNMAWNTIMLKHYEELDEMAEDMINHLRSSLNLTEND
jgi:hypothetical protein